jgi:hypothetical protein
MEVFRAISILINTLLGGYSYETLCGRCYRLSTQNRLASVGVRVLNRVFFWQRNHCRRCYLADHLIKSRNFERREVLKLAEEMDR